MRVRQGVWHGYKQGGGLERAILPVGEPGWPAEAKHRLPSAHLTLASPPTAHLHSHVCAGCRTLAQFTPALFSPSPSHLSLCAATFVLEVGSEELPPDDVVAAMEQLK